MRRECPSRRSLVSACFAFIEICFCSSWHAFFLLQNFQATHILDTRSGSPPGMIYSLWVSRHDDSVGILCDVWKTGSSVVRFFRCLSIQSFAIGGMCAEGVVEVSVYVCLHTIGSVARVPFVHGTCCGGFRRGLGNIIDPFETLMPTTRVNEMRLDVRCIRSDIPH